MKGIAVLLENLPDLLLGQETVNLQALRQEYASLDYQLQFSESYRLWDIAELKYQWGLTCYRLGRALNEKLFLKQARDAFEFVYCVPSYRHSTCTTEMLERLIRVSETHL